MAMKKGLAERLAQGPLAARLRTSLRDKIAAADNRIGKLRLRITRFGDEIEEARPEAEKAERMRDALPATARSEFARFDRRARDRRAYIAFREAWIADDERTIAAVEAARQADQAQLDGLPAPITRNQKASDADVDVGRVDFVLCQRAKVSPSAARGRTSARARRCPGGRRSCRWRTRKAAARRFTRARSRAGSKRPGGSCCPARFAPASERTPGFTRSATARLGSSARSRRSSATRAAT